MFERYNEHARRVIFFARFSASQAASSSIASDHLLLGLVREASPIFARMAPAVSVEELYSRIPRKIVVEDPSVRIHMPLSAESKRILAYAAEEASDLDHRHVGAEHLLLGILRESTCCAAGFLAEVNVNLEDLRQRLVNEGTQSNGADSGTAVPVEVDRDSVHALVDRLPEEMLGPIKGVIDRMLSRARKEDNVVSGTFSQSRAESGEGTPKYKVRRQTNRT